MALRYTDDDMVDAIARVAGELGRTPRVSDYADLRRAGEPTHQAVQYRFGSWAYAVGLAGLDPVRSVVSPRPRYTEDDYAAALRRVAAALGEVPRMADYARLRRAGEPTVHAFQWRYGSWAEAVRLLRDPS